MNKLFILLASTFLFTINIVLAQNVIKANIKKSEKAKIAILGTFHFEGSKDYGAVYVDSLSSNKRQNELEQLIRKIKKYNPTKIMIEWEPKYKSETDEELKLYLQNKFELPLNEVYQLGFRLAKEMGLQEVFPVDWNDVKGGLGDKKLIKYLKQNNKILGFQEVIKTVQQTAEEDTKFLKNHTILEYFQKLNTSEYDNFNRNLYLEEIPNILREEGGNPLLEYCSNWYKRNIFIMGEIDRHIEEKDRVLVLIGAGHRAILKELYSNRTHIEYVEIGTYLK